MNCATGCTSCAARGRMPTHTPIGTHNRLASAIKMNTRNMVMLASPQTCKASRSGVFFMSYRNDMPEPSHHRHHDERHPHQVERTPRPPYLRNDGIIAALHGAAGPQKRPNERHCRS